MTVIGMAIPKNQEFLCESESMLYHRAAYVVESFVLIGFWSIFLLFLFAVVLELSRGNYSPRFFFVILWGGAALLLTWIVVPKFQLARLRAYSGGFILPRKIGLLREVFVTYREIESAVELSEDRIEIRWRGGKHILTRRDYGKCFNILRSKILENQGL